jgi:hypothetical protein
MHFAGQFTVMYLARFILRPAVTLGTGSFEDKTIEHRTNEDGTNEHGTTEP